MKNVLSLLLVLILTAAVFAGCSDKKDLSYAVTGTVNGETKEFPVGPYRYYVQWMTDYYYAYLSYIASQSNSKMTWTEMLADTSFSGGKMTLSDSIIESAKDQYMTYLYIDVTFDALGLTLDAEDEKEVDRIIQQDWVALYGNDGFNTIRQTLGMSYDEFRNLMACNIKSEKILDYYYGEGGPNEISEQEMKDHFVNNYVRFKYVVMMTQDSDGNEYNDTKMAKIEANKNAVLAELEKGTDITALIPQYSDDYTEITDDLTASEKESLELQNKTMLEDGLIINDKGVFSESLATYYNITVDEDIVDKAFSLKNGEYAAVTIDDSVWIIQRLDHNEKESYFTDVKDSVFKTLYADDLSAKHTDWRSRLNYVYNEDVIDAYRPEYLADLFKFSDTTGSGSEQ
ncbi:MAG: hypothetical protein J6B86_06820 [Clostridia bacterium]|nr:hypothetical protein [Clostridia bacterium]